MKVKMICFDMDGTIADLYGVSGWLEKLRAFDPTPYAEAEPMWDMSELNEVLMALKSVGTEIRIITWLSMESTVEYSQAVRETKREWLDNLDFPYDNFHGVRYGATKADSVRKYLAENENAILIDDNAKVREGWHLGEAVDPTAINIVEYLKGLLNQ